MPLRDGMGRNGGTLLMPVVISMRMVIEVETEDGVQPVVIEVTDPEQSFGVRQVRLHDGVKLGNRFRLDMMGRRDDEQTAREILTYTMSAMVAGLAKTAREQIEEKWGTPNA